MTSTADIRCISKNSIEGKAKKIAYCPTLNCFVVTNERGECFITDSSMESIFGPIYSGSTTGVAEYLRSHDCLMLSDSRQLTIRRDIGGTYLLRTALNGRLPGIVADEIKVDVELTSSEAAKLLQYLLSPGIKLSTEKSRDVLAQLRKQLPEGKEVDKNLRSGKWLTCIIRGEYGFLHTMFSSIVSDLRQTNSRTAVLPVASAIVERLNLMKSEPYSFDLNSEGSGYEKSTLASESARRMTLARWPHMNYKWCLPEQMAEAGFYHQPNNSGDDRVMCFVCNVCLVCWEPTDEPWSEHERHAPNCPFIREEYTQNVPISVTYASTTAIDHGASTDICQISSTSNCDWIATSTQCGEVVLWNVAKELQKTDVIVLDPSDSFVELETGYRPRAAKTTKVAWADDADNINFFPYGSAEAVVVDSLRDFIDMSANEIANEIVAVCPQKGDINVGALCCVGRASQKDDYEYVGAPTSSSSNVSSLIVGCGILEAKLQSELFQRSKNGSTSENAASPSSSPMSSFVQNLNTVNKSISSEMIVAPLDRSTGEEATAAAPTPFVANHRTYRPFILVYRIEEVKELKRHSMQIGVSDDEKNDKARSSAGKGSTSMKKTLNGEMIGFGGFGGNQNILDNSDTLDLLDDDSSLGKEASWMDAAMDLNYEMTNYMNNNSFGGGGADATGPKFPMLTSEDVAGVDSDLAPFSSSQSSTTYESAWPTPSTAASMPAEMHLAPTKFAINTDSTNMEKTVSSMYTPGGCDDLLKIEYTRPKAKLAIVQCVRLPPNLNDTAFYVHSIVPTLDGLNLLVVVNRNNAPTPLTSVVVAGTSKVSSSQVCSAILVFALTFNGTPAVGVQERPVRQCLYDFDVGTMKSVVCLPKDSVKFSQKFDGVVVLTDKGEILLIDVDSGRILTRLKDKFEDQLKFSTITYVSEEKFAAATETGEVYVLEVFTDSKLSEYIEKDFNEFNDETIDDYKDAELLVNKPFSFENLKSLWNLTRSEMSLIGSHLCVQTPSCWIEVQQHQRLRKSPQHYLREEKMTRSWHIVPDGETWKEHIFEITLPTNYNVSHLDFKYTLRQNTPGPPFVQVSLLQQQPRQVSRCSSRQDAEFLKSGGIERRASTSADVTSKVPNGCIRNRILDEQFLNDLNAKLICGPIDLVDSLDLNDQNGLIQFSSPLFSYSKNRTFLIHMQATSEESETKKYKKRVQHKKAARIAEQQNNLKDAATKSASGMFYQKYGSTAIPKSMAGFGKTSQAGLKVIHQKTIADMKKEDFKGCDWIQEISLTLWKAKKVNVAQERKQRLALIENYGFHTRLMQLFTGDNATSTYPSSTWCQSIVLDIFSFIVSQVYASSAKIVKNIGRAFVANLDSVVKCVFLSNSRTIARKFVVFVAHLFKNLKSCCNLEEVGLFLSQLKTSLMSFVKFVPAAQSSGCLLWFFVVLEQMQKLQPTDLYSLNEELLFLLKRLGDEMVSKSNPLHQILYNKYGLCGLPFDLEMFELPFPMLQLVSKPQQPFSYAAATAHGNCLTANFTNQFGNDELDWADIIGIEYAKSLTSVANPRKGKLIRLDREHLYGMLEVDPLQFTCHCASENIRLENSETGLSLPIQSNSATSSSGPGPIPLPPEMSQFENAANPHLVNAASSVKQQVQNILSKQMQLLALQQEKQKLQGNLQEHVAMLSSEQNVSTTQASSASTFGVPTTPKTTPFMTPTPLSPYQLSPVSSEVNMESYGSQFSGEESTGSAAAQAKAENLNFVPLDLLKPPPPQSLLIDRMNSGARKFVVVNFGRPVLLTDFILPQCSDLGSLSVDVWLKSETADGQRLVVCSDIGRKSFVVCDLQPPALCQFLKITYIGRYGLGSCSSKISLGAFYGYTYFEPWQVDLSSSSSSDAVLYDECATSSSALMSAENLRQLADDLRFRYGLACSFLKDLLEQPTRLWEVTKDQNYDTLLKDAYKECMQVKLQYNLILRTLTRMSANSTTSSSDMASYASNVVARCPTLANCSVDKLRVISELVLGCLLRLTPFSKLDSMAGFNVPLDLDATIEVFEQFCMKGPVSLQALCCIWVLQQAGAAEWWGNFFAKILDKFKSDAINSQLCEKIFLMLSFLMERSIAAGNDFVVYELLNHLDSILNDNLLTDRKIVWFLMLISTGLDYFPRCKIVGDRWNFVLGEYSRSHFYGLPQDMDYRLKESKESIKLMNQNIDKIEKEIKEFAEKPFGDKTFAEKASKLNLEMKEFADKATMSKPPSIKISSKSLVNRESKSSSSSKSKKQSPRRSSLRLPRTLCVSVLKKLASCILRQEFNLTAENFVLFTKVLTSIARCSRPYLHIMDVFSDQDVKKLLELALTARNICVRHACICLIQDFLEVESSCVRRRAATAAFSSQQSTLGSASSLFTSDLSFSDDSAFGTASALNVSSPSTAFPMLSIANEVKESPGSSSTPPTVTPTVLDLDSTDIPDTPAGAQQLIENLISNAKPEELTNNKIEIDLEKRKKELKNMCKESVYSKLTSGYPFKQLKTWVKSAQLAEKAFAEKSLTIQQYEKQVQKFIQMHSTGYGKEFIDVLSNSLFASSMPMHAQSAVAYVPQISWEDVTPPSGYVGGAVGPSSNFLMPLLYQHTYANSMSNAPGTSKNAENLSQAKDTLSKFCEQLQTSAAASSHLIPSASHDSSAILADFGPAEGFQAMGGASEQGSAKASINLDDSDSSSRESEPETPVAPPSTDGFTSIMPPPPSVTSAFWNTPQKLNAQTHFSVNAEITLPKDPSVDFDLGDHLNSLQPVSMSLDERMESQFGWRFEVETRRWLFTNNSSLKWALKTAAPMKRPAKFSLVRSDAANCHVHLSSTSVFSGAVSSVFETLTVNTPTEYVESLLQMFFALVPRNVSKRRRETDTTSALGELPRLILSDSAMDKFMNWLIEALDVSERVWTLSFKILSYGIQSKDLSFLRFNVAGSILTDNERLEKLFRKIFRSTAAFSNSGKDSGPVIGQAFFDFLQAINSYCMGIDDKTIGANFKHLLLQSLEEILSANCYYALDTCPLDVLTKMLEFLQSQQFATLDVELFVRLMNATATSLKFYLSSCSAFGQPTLPNGAGNPRYCFRLGKSDLLGNNEFRSYHDRSDVFMIALIKLVDKFLRSSFLFDHNIEEIFVEEASITDEAKTTKRKKSTSDVLLANRRNVVNRLLSCLSLCFCDSTDVALETLAKKIADVDASNIVTVTDGVLLLLVDLEAKGANACNVVDYVVEYLRASRVVGGARYVTLSEPLAAFIGYVLSANNEESVRRFIDMNGLHVLSERFLEAGFPFDSEVYTEETQLLRKAASLCANVQKSSSESSLASTLLTSSSTNASTALIASATAAASAALFNAPKKLSHMQVDGWTNFAPLCQIVSSSPMAHHLTALLNSTPQHRRARSAAWSYHFYPAESWLDVTLTLPYPVVLKEIQIRPHLAALQNCPGAVQVELSPDGDVKSFFVLGSPCVTAGCTKIRISTENCVLPVQMVRLHLKRPPDSPNLGVSQILLLGHSPLSSENELCLEKVYWLNLLHFCLKRVDVGETLRTKSYDSTRLVENLINSFLSYRFSQTSFEQLVDCIVLMTDAAVIAAPMQTIFDGITRTFLVSTESEIWLVELLNRLCPKDAKPIRLSFLLNWISNSLETFCSKSCKLSTRLLSVLIWSASCVFWRTASFVDVFLPDNLTSSLKSILKTSKDADLKRACAYLLSTICCFHNAEFLTILQNIDLEKIVNRQHRVNKSTKTHATPSTSNELDSVHKNATAWISDEDFAVLTCAAENSTCVKILMQRKILSAFVSRLTKLCRDGMSSNVASILSLVEFFGAISCEDSVKDWLIRGEGSEFWLPLLTNLIDERVKNVECDAFTDSVFRKLENATIILLERCILFSVDGQRLIGQILCNLLSRSAHGLSSPLQQILLRVLLSDERLHVILEDQKFFATSVTFTHPKFGCGIHLDVREVSAHTLCQSLVPITAAKSSNFAIKKLKISPWTNYYQAEFSGTVGVSPFTDVLNAGDKAKAKRLASKVSSYGSASGSSKSSQQTQSISFVCCPTLNKDCLPGKLSLGQLLSHVQRTTSNQNVNCIFLKIDYALPTEINEKMNESLLSTKSASTGLKVFANMGGLALLAQHLQLYQPSISLQNTRNNASYYNENELKILEDMDSSAAKQYLADEDVLDTTYDAYDWVTLMPPGAESSAADGMQQPFKPAYDRLRSIINVGLSPHVAVCFGVFLRLPGYAELLVGQNSRQAQWLLRLALGVTSDSNGVNILTSADASILTTLPFDILASLYASKKWSAEDGRSLRQVSIDFGVVQLLLSCLSAFSHHQPKSNTSSSDRPDVVRLVDQVLAALASAETSFTQSTDDKGQLYWAKGTGFGTGSTQRQWNIDLHILKQKQDEQNITFLLKVLTSFLYPGDVLEMTQKHSSSTSPTSSSSHWPPSLESSVLTLNLVRSLFESCLTSTLRAYLRNDSVLDMSRHTAVYDSVIRIICAIALCPQLRAMLFENSEQQSLKSLLFKLKECVDTYVSKLEPLKREKESNPPSQPTSVPVNDDSAAEEGLLKLVPLIELAAHLMQRLNHADDSDVDEAADDDGKSVLEMTNLSNEEKYTKLMKSLQYDSVKFFDVNGSFAVPFHYESLMKSSAKDSGALAPRVRRLAQEAVTLSTSLPLSYSSSVFVRCSEERLDVMKVLMTGPSGTPYADGCFEFDVWFPNDYPNSPMHINLQTTGGNTVRFNPNLYNDGKVCLSVLNTWHGRPEERWNAQTSSFLQVLVSIQSLILVPDPYFNEPGYERTRGTPAGQQASRDYDANIRIATVRWGMLEMLRCPPTGFKQVVQRHFWIKKDEILRMIESWIAEMSAETGGATEKRAMRSTATQSLKRHYYALKEEFAKMTSPCPQEMPPLAPVDSSDAVDVADSPPGSSADHC